MAGEGIDWPSARVLDPACGGGAFLVPLAKRIVNDHRLRALRAEQKLRHLEEHLSGIEIDSFAAWMSQTFLQLLVHPLSRLAGRPLALDIQRADALDRTSWQAGRFDLVIGNPPYGKIRLDAARRSLFGRSLFGHANLYGLFLDGALRWRSTTGLVAFVTPTSFLGGQYFTRLRGLLLDSVPPLSVDFVEERTGVFDSVQQETCLAVFGPNPSRTAAVSVLHASDGAARATRVGVFSLDRRGGGPWLLPRSLGQGGLAERAQGMRTRLHDLGFRASTGPLVWNRHKGQLRSRRERNTYPLIWAEAVRPNHFAFEYRLRAHAPFFALQEEQEHLLTWESCVLVQRTTAKEQRRRLVACVVPPEFLEEWHAVVVENHVNVLLRAGGDSVAPETLAAVLNTDAVDQIFRCFSGTVAVSATELHALPLPPRDVFSAVAETLADGPAAPPCEAKGRIEEIVGRAYGVGASRARAGGPEGFLASRKSIVVSS